MKCICHKLSAPSAILFSSSSWPDRFCGLNPEPMKAPTSGTRSTPAQWEEHFEGILIRAEGLERRKLVAHFEFGCSFHAKHVVDVVEIEGCKWPPSKGTIHSHETKLAPPSTWTPEHLNCQESRKQLEGQAAGYWSWMVALPRLVQHMPKPSKAHGHSVSLFRKVAKMDEGKRTFGWRVLVSFDDTASENKTTATTSTTTPSTFTFYPPAAPTTSEVGVCLLGGGWVPKECWLICKIEPLERPGHSQWTKCHWIHNLQGCIDSHNATMALFSWPFWII